jgi:hypothetical protein
MLLTIPGPTPVLTISGPTPVLTTPRPTTMYSPSPLPAPPSLWQDGVQRQIVEPLYELGEGLLDPLLSLTPETRKLIPKWQVDVLAESVGALRAHGFGTRDVNTLVHALYTARDGDEAGAEASRRAWRVLRAQAKRFDSEEALAIAADKTLREEAAEKERARRERRRHGRRSADDDGEDEDEEEGEGEDGEEEALIERDALGRRLLLEETFRHDHQVLEAEPCKRMLWLLAAPLMKRGQLEAIFTAFDQNRDGQIQFDELEHMLRMLDPHRRLHKLRPIAVPHEDSALEKMAAACADAAAPGIEAARSLWQRFAAKDDDDEYYLS